MLADNRYDAVVIPGSAFVESSAKGTLGYRLNLEYEDGETSFVIWLTDANRERAVETFAMLGVTEEQRADPTFCAERMERAVTGREIVFGTKLEEYPKGSGKTEVKIAWIGKRRAAGATTPAAAAASFFSGKPVVVPAAADDAADESELDDDPIPF